MASSKKNSKSKSSSKQGGNDKARDLFFAGVGLAANAKEHVANLVEDLKKQGKLSKPEGEKIVNNFIADTKKARDKFEKDVKESINEGLKKVAYASKNELEVLKKRIKELEGKGIDFLKRGMKKEKDMMKNEKAMVKDVKKAVTGKAAKVKKVADKAVKKATAKAPSTVKAIAKKAVAKTAPAKAAVKKAVAKKAAAPKTASAKPANNTSATNNTPNTEKSA